MIWVYILSLLLLDINSRVEFSNFSIFVKFFIDKHAYCNGTLIFHFSFTMFIYQDRPFWFISSKIYFDLVILSMFPSFNGPISGRSRDWIQSSVEWDDRGREQPIKRTFLGFNIIIQTFRFFFHSSDRLILS